MIQGGRNDAPADATTPTRLIWSGSAVPTEPTGPSPRRCPRMTELTDRMALAGPGVGLRDLQHQEEHQRRGARWTRRSRAGYSGQRRLTRTLPRMPGVSAGWCHVVLDSVSASSWGGDPPARLLGADDSRETDSGRGDSARRPPPSTHASEFNFFTRRGVRHTTIAYGISHCFSDLFLISANETLTIDGTFVFTV